MILKTRNQHQEESCALLEVTRLLKLVGCARSRSQFHTVLENQKSFFSMEVYAWMAFPLDLSDLVIEVFHSALNRTNESKRESRGNPSAVVKPNMHNPIPIKHTNVIATNIDHIPPNTSHSVRSALLFVFEDNEAVIKMIIKGRSLTMMHVSRTRRVALDKHADTLTKDNFTHDEWHLFNISHFSSTCCDKNSSLINKEKQEVWQNRELQRGTCLLMFRQVPHPHQIRLQLHPKVQGHSQQRVKPESRMRINSESDAASSSQVRLQDAFLGGSMGTARVKLVASEVESRDIDNSESEFWTYKKR